MNFKNIFGTIHLVKCGPHDFVLKADLIKCEKARIRFAFGDNHSFVCRKLFEWGSLDTIR